jgi:hypothetical protein
MSEDEKMLTEGDQYFVKRKPARKYEARLILAQIGPQEFLSLTPSGDVKLENLSDASLVHAFRDPDDDVPSHIGKALTDFSEMPTEDEYNELQVSAYRDRDEIIASRTKVAATSKWNYKRSTPAVRDSSDQPQPFSGDKPSSSVPIPISKEGTSGQPVVPHVNTSQLSGGLGALSQALGVGGNRKVVTDLTQEIFEMANPEDVRVLTVKYDRQGQRWREFREGVGSLEVCTFEDWPVSGPQTVIWVCKWILNRAGSPLAWHAQWKAVGKLQDSDPQVIIHESACRVLETAVCYDQLNVTSLAAFEVVARQLQISEDKLSHRFDDTPLEGYSDYSLMSGSTHKSQLCICPQLKAWTAGELSKESAVLKERRKAREEKVLANPKRNAKPPAGGSG